MSAAPVRSRSAKTRQTAALEAIARARVARERCEHEETFRKTLVQARAAGHSWGQLAAVSGLSRAGVRWLVDETQRSKDAARRERRKGEK